MTDGCRLRFSTNHRSRKFKPHTTICINYIAPIMKWIFSILAFAIACVATAQKDTALLNLEKKYNAITDVDEKLNTILSIGEKAALFHPELIQPYAEKAIFIGEQSRDKTLTAKGYRVASVLYAYYSRDKNRYETANTYALKAVELSAAQNVTYKEKVYSLNNLAGTQFALGKKNEALQYSQEALEMANESNVDSFKITTLLKYGDVQQQYGDKIKAFKNFLAAREIAEKTKEEKTKLYINRVYSYLISLYTGLESYDKAIDYLYKLLHHYRTIKNVDSQLDVLARIGSTYSNAKKFIAAKGVYEQMGQLADSVKNTTIKTRSKIGMLNAILESDDKLPALAYLRNNPDILDVFYKSGYVYTIHFGLGNMFSALKMYDSANIYYEKAKPEIMQKNSYQEQLEFNLQYAVHLFHTNKHQASIQYLTSAATQADSLKIATAKLAAVEYLDSCYQKMGDYKQAFFYNSLRDKIKKDIDEKSKAKDVLLLEIENENKRAERLAQEEAEAIQKRHNWQYMAIIIGILSLFSLLAVLGVFHVPVKWVRALGFIAFIFLFEFIILIFDTWIHHATHGEPLKILSIKVVLIAVLLPLHHWLEHKALDFITTRKKLDILKKKENNT